MQLIFRSLRPDEAPTAGELFIRPREEKHRLAVASVVLEQGLPSLEQGPGPVTHLVVNCSNVGPTLDEMLAGTLARRLLDRQALPPGLKAFARYAALVHEGLRPSDLPAEGSPEGIYLAIRNAAGSDLIDAAAGEKFLAGWDRMADCIWQAAEAGQDPFAKALFSGPDFAKERAYLTSDREVYRQDVLRGQRWLVRLPGGPPESSALVLRQPRSLLFKYWSRRDRKAPVGQTYLFLAVEWGKGEWVFSTDPVMGISLLPLAKLLQEAEARSAAANASENPWFDGQRFQHTLVAAPKGGTRLPEKQVLGIVRKWTRARQVGPRRWLTAAALAGAAVVLVVLTHLLWPGPTPPPPPPQPQPPPAYELGKFMVNGKEVPVERGLKPHVGPYVYFEQKVKLRASANDVSLGLLTGPVSEPQAIKIWASLEAKESLPVSQIQLRVNDQTYPLTLKSKSDNHVDTEEQETVLLPGTENEVHLLVQNSSDQEPEVGIQFHWRNTKLHNNLYAWTIGISNYQDPKWKLNGCDKDALDLEIAFKKQQGVLFDQVITKPLPNDQAGKDDILRSLEDLCKCAEHGQLREYDLVIVTFSGHGMKTKGGQFYFLPWNYEDSKPPDSTGLSWDAIWGYLSQLPCQVVVVMDACHSGTIKAVDLVTPAETAQSKIHKKGHGVFILAACLEDETAKENDQHGALTQALLEALDVGSADNGASDMDVITLEDLSHYAIKRVPKLVTQQNVVRISLGGDISPDNIQITRRVPPKENGK
jgi:hypothetical protein